MRELLQFVSSVRLQAAHSGNLQAALNAAGHEHKIISNFLKLLSERNEVAELTFTASPQYKQLRALVLRVTEPHEAARLALAEALIEFEKEQ